MPNGRHVDCRADFIRFNARTPRMWQSVGVLSLQTRSLEA